MTKHVANGDGGWTPDRMIGQASQMLIQEESGSLVGEYDCRLG
jgi:hypothetical protein